MTLIFGCSGSGPSETPPALPPTTVETPPAPSPVTADPASPDFSLSATQPSPIQVGGAGPFTVTVQRTGGHSAEIALTLAENPQGITGSGRIDGGLSSGEVTLTVPLSVSPATYPLDLTGTDGSLTHSTSFNLTVVSALTITTPSPLAVGSIGAPYLLDLAATGGASPYTWSIAGGSLPPGMALSATGALSGTPTGTGSFSVTAQVTDGVGVTTTKALTFPINDALLSALGANGSFEQNLTGWTQIGAGLGAQYAIVTDAVQGANAVRVTSRSQLFHAPGQNVFSNLLANANGTPVTTRFWIKLDAPGMARCLINLTSDLGGGQSAVNKLILAEQMVRTADVWVEVSGTATLAWSGTLTGATLEFNVGQPAENVHPGFTLDDIRLQRDADADGLPDADESPNAANNPDRDNDGLPDDWEVRYSLSGLLDPDRADADLDADTDGFSNREEFWAATDPLDTTQKPGVPSVDGVNADVIALTKYLALLPSRQPGRERPASHRTALARGSRGGVRRQRSGAFRSDREVARNSQYAVRRGG